MRKSHLLLFVVLCIGWVYGDTTWVTLDAQYDEGSQYITSCSHSDDDSTLITISLPGFYYYDDSVDGDEYQRLELAKMPNFSNDSVSLRTHALRGRANPDAPRQLLT